jgi:hypothetical protein
MRRAHRCAWLVATEVCREGGDEASDGNTRNPRVDLEGQGKASKPADGAGAYNRNMAHAVQCRAVGVGKGPAGAQVRGIDLQQSHVELSICEASAG